MIMWSINSVTAVVDEVTVKKAYLLISDITYYKVSKPFNCNPVLLTVLEESPCSRGPSRINLAVLVLVFVLEPQVLVLKP